jgi:predicted nucleotidyltransferase
MVVVPASLPEVHRVFIDRAVKVLSSDSRVIGVAAAGSYADDTMDEFSDIDLVIAVEPQHEAEVSAERQKIAASLGGLLIGFTGEHVGEPRLLICLYGSPLLHVDLKFVALADFAHRVDDPIVLWERDNRLTQVLQREEAMYPRPDLQWIEDRFWVWIHYVSSKIGRGELFEALDALAFLRANILGPLGLSALGLRPSRVRRIETVAPTLAKELQATVATCDPGSLFSALRACVLIYQKLLAGSSHPIERRLAAETAVLVYLGEIEARCRSRA